MNLSPRHYICTLVSPPRGDQAPEVAMAGFTRQSRRTSRGARWFESAINYLPLGRLVGRERRITPPQGTAMGRVAYRLLFLILLLAADWYLDTSNGQSPFERSLGSTEIVCHSLTCKHHLTLATELPTVLPLQLPLHASVGPSDSPELLGWPAPLGLGDHDLAYLYMCIIC